MAFSMYPGLTQGAIAALLVHGTRRAEEDVHLPKMIDRQVDRHHEPHRAALRHGPRAAAHQGGQAGRRQLQDHRHEDFHLRPASTTSPRTSSISCSRASKARRRASRASRCSSCRSSCVNADGSLGARNGVSCGSIEHKMGIHGNSTCVMNYDGATGWLIGEENQGLNAMFVMMNEARLGVGVQGLAQSEVAYQNAVDLREGAPAGPRDLGREGAGQAGRSDHRASGRAPHADDDQARSTRPRARFVIWTALQGDVAHRSDDEKERAGGRRSHGAADAGAEGRADRHRLRQRGDRRSRCSAATATSPSTAWSSSCAMRASR